MIHFTHFQTFPKIRKNPWKWSKIRV